MTGLDLLYKYASEERIYVYFDHIGFSPATTIREPDETFNIAIDPEETQGEYAEKTVLMHELAHIATGSFYTNKDDIFQRRKAENRANRWLIKHMIPFEDLTLAIENGYTEIWSLAEYFEVSEDLMNEAIEYYKMLK